MERYKIKNHFPRLNNQVLLTLPLLTMSYVSFQKQSLWIPHNHTVYVYVPVSAPCAYTYTPPFLGIHYRRGKILFQIISV